MLGPWRTSYVATTNKASFSPSARDIFERFDFYTQIKRLAKANLLYLVTEKFANIDLHPNRGGPITVPLSHSTANPHPNTS